MAPTSIDGNEITGATIDGQDVSEITVDGQTVFEAGPDIPDGSDLHAHFDAAAISATDGDTISTWTDQTGNGFDLTAGSAPVYRDSAINANPSLEFDFADYLDVQFSALSQPNTIFAVVQIREGIGDNNTHFIFDGRGTGRNGLNYNTSDNFSIFAGNVEVEDGSADANPHIISTLFDGSNSSVRKDGGASSTGNAGSDSLDGFSVGSDNDQSANSSVFVSEILIYPQDKSGIQSDVESYLADKWGITI